MKIAVLYGGTSNEREVSLNSGKGIIHALKSKGHEVIGIDFHPNRLEEIIHLKDEAIDMVFIGLHGRYGEDGRVQGLLDMLGLNYVGSNVLASALAMDKQRAKIFFKEAGIPVAKDRLVQKKTFNKATFSVPFEFPIVVKPNHEGSTIGLTIASNEHELIEGIEKAFLHDEEVLVEEFIKGRELTVAVMGDFGKEKSLPIIEIISKNELYDYEAKYAPGMSEHIVPAPLDEAVSEKIKRYAVLAHQAIGCEVYSRVDFLLKENKEPIILEVNTLPGMTETSLFPDAAKVIGLSYADMIEQFIQLSLRK